MGGCVRGEVDVIEERGGCGRGEGGCGRSGVGENEGEAGVVSAEQP